MCTQLVLRTYVHFTFVMVRLRFGPIVHFWCMRYEAKHCHFKRMASIIGNFTNLPYTLAKRHQLQMCYSMVNSAIYLNQETSFGKGQGEGYSGCTYYYRLRNMYNLCIKYT